MAPSAADERPGLWITVSGGSLPVAVDGGARIAKMTREAYLDLVDKARGYVPAREPVKSSDAATWPKFPGEGEDYSSVRGPVANPHMGGPR